MKGLRQALTRLPLVRSTDYAFRHSHFVAEVLQDRERLEPFARGEALPPGFGVGLDERVVELPWVFAQELHGSILDAGSALNHHYVLQRVLRRADCVHVVTLAPEPLSFVDLGVSYVFADLRDLPYRDAWFDVVASISTLEHVGMDNSVYGGAAERAPDPAFETTRVVRELRRVLRADGLLLVTLPYGVPADHGWFRQFGREDVERFVADADAREVGTTVYRYSPGGWQVSGLEEASDATYRSLTGDTSPAPDGAAAAGAVACLALRFA